MTVSKGKNIVKVPKSSGTTDEEFSLCCLRMRRALSGKGMASALTIDDVSAEITGNLSMIIFALGDSSL